MGLLRVKPCYCQELLNDKTQEIYCIYDYCQGLKEPHTKSATLIFRSKGRWILTLHLVFRLLQCYGIPWKSGVRHL